jgi:hypothetical protein
MGANQLCLIGLQHDFSENRERRFRGEDRANKKTRSVK